MDLAHIQHLKNMKSFWNSSNKWSNEAVFKGNVIKLSANLNSVHCRSIPTWPARNLSACIPNETVQTESKLTTA